jgi:hypothetical protein
MTQYGCSHVSLHEMSAEHLSKWAAAESQLRRSSSSGGRPRADVLELPDSWAAARDYHGQCFASLPVAEAGSCGEALHRMLRYVRRSRCSMDVSVSSGSCCNSSPFAATASS